MVALMRMARNLVLTGAVVAAAILAAGFWMFVGALDRSESMVREPVDGIVALTGGADRINEAVDLLMRGRGARLLITGVHEKTTREELSRVHPDARSAFACCVDLDYRALNTIGNAEQTRLWARQHGFRSLLVVTSSYHMPRTLAEISHVLPDVKIFAHSVVPESMDIDGWWREPQLARLLAFEYVKYVAAVARMQFGHRDAATDTAAAGAPASAAGLRPM
jgi:uncharacterized SAM-binding protein YcdF (DUF218 family)